MYFLPVSLEFKVNHNISMQEALTVELMVRGGNLFEKQECYKALTLSEYGE